MAFTEDTNYKTGDSNFSILRKILTRLNLGLTTSGGGGGGGGSGTSQILDGSGSGALANVSVAKALLVDLANTTTNTFPIKVSGNVGGITTVIKLIPAIATSAYSAGFTVGGIQTLTNAFTSAGSGVLESLTIYDASKQNAAMDILIFDANPNAATTTDHAAFVLSTDNAKLVGRISVAASDYATINSAFSVAVKTGLGLALKATVGTTLYAVAVTSGTPTYAALALNFAWGILQD